MAHRPAARSIDTNEATLDIFIGGTGSFAAEIAAWAHAAGRRVVGLVELFDDDSNVGMTRHGFEVSRLQPAAAGVPVVLGVGGSRRAGLDRLVAGGWSPCGVVHPSAVLAGDVRVGEGATIGPLAVVGAASVIGAHVLISRGALVGHHVVIGAFSILNPGANIGGNTTIGEDVFVGIGATVVNGRSIGDRVVVAAGAVVVDDVGPDTRVQGVPARPVEPNPA
jgi:sugar O-acyltransferase (sialic acid O-acetyltransferase NeuD family)